MSKKNKNYNLFYISHQFGGFCFNSLAAPQRKKGAKKKSGEATNLFNTLRVIFAFIR